MFRLVLLLFLLLVQTHFGWSTKTAFKWALWGGSVLWVGIKYLNHQPSIENPDHADFLSRKKKEEAISGHWS